VAPLLALNPQALSHPPRAGRFSWAVGMPCPPTPHDFPRRAAAAGPPPTTMADLDQAEDQRGEPQQGSVLR
jgi:hypothetical protein